MGYLVNINGTLCQPADAHISVFDRGFLYGDSVYETLRTYHGRAFRLETHLERLANSAALIELGLPAAAEGLAAEVRRTLAASGNSESAIRVVVTRGEGPMALVPEEVLVPNLVIMVRPWVPLPARLYAEGVRAAVVSRLRNAPQALDPNIKSGNFLNNILAAREATAAGAFEGIMLTSQGYVTEGTTSNIFVASGGRLLTPDGKAGLLRGITRELVLRLARDAGIEVEVRDVTERELRAGDELFVTSTLKEILPVTELDGRPVGDAKVGPITSRLIRSFQDAVERFVATGDEP